MIKIVKFGIIFMFISIVFQNPLYSQESPTPYELIFNNQSTTKDIFVKCYPVSAIYNNYNELNLRTAHQCSTAGNEVYFNNGTRKLGASLETGFMMPKNTPAPRYGFNGDIDGDAPQNQNGNFGAGIYKLIITAYVDGIESEVWDITVEMDAYLSNDYNFTYYDDLHLIDPTLSGSGFYFWAWDEASPHIKLPNIYTLKNWKPYENSSYYERPKEFGDFSYSAGTSSNPNEYDYLPQVCITDCHFVLNNITIYQNQNNINLQSVVEGRIPLNTTIRKNITTRVNYPEYSLSYNDVVISAEPGVKLVISNGETEGVANPISFTLNDYSGQPYGNKLIIKSPPLNDLLIQEQTVLELKDVANVLNSSYNAILNIGNRCNTTIQERAKLICGKYSQIVVNTNSVDVNYGTMDWDPGSIVEMRGYSQIWIKSNGYVINHGAIYSNTVGSEIKVDPDGTYELSENQSQTISTGGKINLNGGTLILKNNAHLILDGIDANIIATSGSHIKLGDNALIEIKNGGNFIANGCIIESNPGVTGRGINIENAGSSTTITNCTFTNLKYSLRISNDNSTTANTYRYIYNNTFTTNSLCEFVLELRNAKNTTIQDNHIIMSGNSGLGLLLRYPTYLQNDDDPPTTSTVNIIHNDIYNGLVSCAILSFTNSVVPILFKDNILYGSGVTFNLIERQISGSIKNNQFTNGMENCNLELSQSSPDIFNNIFLSNSSNINNYYSYPKLAPETKPTTDAGWIWVGGKNKLTSTSFGNYYFVDGYATLDWGENCFFKPASTNMKYLWGGVTKPQSDGYLMRNNDFNGTNSPDPTNFYLFTYPNGPSIAPNFNGSNFECPNIITTDLGTIWQISDRGNGIYDTVYSTVNNSGIPVTPDQYLYSQAFSSNSSAQYYEAIVYLKTLISNYPSSEYIMQGLTDLYMNYISLDTSSNQGTRNILFSDLKNFLDDKILSGLYSDEFNFSAYNYTLMCLTNMTEYIEAKDGYEFIALYHPEAFIRLMASWDYDEILTLLNGSGAISSKEENMTESEFYNHLKKRIDASIGEDPIKQKVLKSYKKAQKEKQNALEKGVKSIIKDEKSANSEISRIKSEESKIDQKTLSVLRYAKTLSKEEKDKKQLEDFLFGKVSLTGSKPLIDNIMPKTYELSQNYPNPFNPSTKIKYSIPKDGLVTLKIFDIAGREIRTLVSELKTAGNYLVEFNASSLSSGVYFYQIKSGDFIQTKRMVLIK